MSRRAPKAFSAYRIVYSNDPGVKVGQVLIDRDVLLHRDWRAINFETGAETSFGGPRVARLCVTCHAEHRKAANLGHDGPCGPDAPRLVCYDAKGRRG